MRSLLLIGLLNEASLASAKDPCAECIERLETACAKNKAASCAALGAHWVLSKQDKRAAAAFTRACELGDMDSCYNLATYLVEGEVVPADPERAFVLFESVCGKRSVRNHVNACVNLGNLYADGPGPMRDEAKAVSLFVEACKAGNSAGCRNAGNHYSAGRGVSKDVARAIHYHELACSKKNSISCFNLGTIYEFNPDLKDVPKAMGYYRRACGVKNGKGCMNAAVIYDRGRGMHEDPALAVKFYQLGCDNGVAEACYNLGYMLAEGRQVPVDMQKAFLLFERACVGGDDYGCRALVAARGSAPR